MTRCDRASGFHQPLPTAWLLRDEIFDPTGNASDTRFHLVATLKINPELVRFLDGFLDDHVVVAVTAVPPAQLEGEY
ncbi:hypothetical protein [Mesorhizobium sp. ES1-4]|uniref:hypothetical protein n=1 Tax=Mesorhizobium sp. ES1-4 TaxID=2876627 RepID=UPI001CCE8B5B|nr:hypothetical protein [Mesorhizobium sp. ES1-4]MBZ9798327.1 hypothetical protein [Mesorhizobium sp. ES1-4]